MPAERIWSYIRLVCLAALLGLTAVAVLFPPQISAPALIAFATLLALALFGALLSLKITEDGSDTSTDFVPLLAGLLLLGPFGAVLLALIELLVVEYVILRKPYQKALFNTANYTLSITVAGLLYHTFGGVSSLTSISFTQSFPPFLVASVGFFTINITLSTNVIALSHDEPFLDTWRSAVGNIFLFDLVMGSLAYLVAFFFVRWGPVALLTAIVPMFGLRYSYGVNIELQRLNQDLLRVLIKTLEARDRYTSGHSVRVSEGARRIAGAMRIRGKQVRHIETAALLHDIGKIDLAYGEILRQTGPLSPEQRELIRSHPDKGVEILRSVRSIEPAILECVRHHHEWFDGNGYPIGLAGSDIPIGARIIMICDSIDAMLTDRPYRAALTVDAVQKELVRNSGSQFDPDMVVAALDSAIIEDIYAPAAAEQGPRPHLLRHSV